MSRLWDAGGETGDDFTEGVTATVGGTGALTYDTAIKRTGARSYKFATTSAPDFVYRSVVLGVSPAPIAAASSGRTYFARGYIYIPTTNGYPASEVNIMSWVGPSILVRLRTNGKLALYYSGTQVGVDTAILALDTWYMVEVRVKIVTAGLDEAELRLNGVSQASSTTVEISTTPPTSFVFGFFNNPGAGEILHFDDLAINDDNGAQQNSWPGEGAYLVCLPVSDNDLGPGWTGGDGAVTNVFEGLNNIPPVGLATGSATDASQVRNTLNTQPQNLDINLQTPTVAGAPAGSIIRVAHGLWVVGRSGGARNGNVSVVNPAIGPDAAFSFGSGNVGTHPSGWTRPRPIVATNPVLALGTTPVIRITNTSANGNDNHADFAALVIDFEPGTIIGEITGNDATSSSVTVGGDLTGDVGIIGVVTTAYSVTVAGLVEGGEVWEGVPATAYSVANGGRADRVDPSSELRVTYHDRMSGPDDDHAAPRPGEIWTFELWDLAIGPTLVIDTLENLTTFGTIHLDGAFYSGFTPHYVAPGHWRFSFTLPAPGRLAITWRFETLTAGRTITQSTRVESPQPEP